MSSNIPMEAVKQPPRTIRIKRPRDETPVTSLYFDDSSPGDSKRIKTSVPQAPTYYFRLAHTVPTPFQPVATTSSSPIPRSDRLPAVLDARKLQPKTSTEQLSRETSGASTPLKRKLARDEDEGQPGTTQSVPGSRTPSISGSAPGTPTETRPGAVRRFILTRETKRKRMHPYKAVFERLQDPATPLNPTAVDGTTSVDTAMGAIDGTPAPPPSPPRKRKLPGIRKDPVEHARLQKLQSERQKEDAKKPPSDASNDEFDLSEEMRRMVLEYLEEDSRNALGGLPATPSAAAKPVDRIGGGLGGGTWDDTKEDEDRDFVYDVYIREEITPENAKAPQGENVGVIVFRGDEDEDWWYENADEDDPDNYAFETDDEDSNAEDYIANEYPDEDEYEWASDDEDRGIYGDDDEDVVEYAGGHALYVGPHTRQRRRTTDSDEEYDLENDSSDEEEGERMRRFARGVLA